MQNLIKKILIILLIIGALVLAGFFCYKYLQTSGKLAQWEMKKIIKDVGAMMLLPKETPTIATVADKTKLEGQAFFTNAQNGDKVLIFSSSGKVILYRPSIKKIIDISTIAVKEATPSPATTQTTDLKIKVALFNGSNTNGLADKMEKNVFSQINGIEIVSKDNAKNKYDTNMIIDVSKKYSELATQLATLLKGQVVSLPDGEKTANADILIILGKNN